MGWIMFSTYTTIVICAAVAFVISLAVTFVLTRKAMSQRCHYLREFVYYSVVEPKTFNYVMTSCDDEGCRIIGFKKWEIDVCRCVMKNGRLEVSRPEIFSLNDLSEIRLNKMRTNAKLYDNNENLVCTLDILQQTTREIYEDFPADIDFNDDALKYYDFIEAFQKKLSDKN